MGVSSLSMETAPELVAENSKIHYTLYIYIYCAFFGAKLVNHVSDVPQGTWQCQHSFTDNTNTLGSLSVKPHLHTETFLTVYCDFPLIKASRPAPKRTQLTQRNMAVLPLALKWPRCDADHAPPSSAGVMKR